MAYHRLPINGTPYWFHSSNLEVCTRGPVSLIDWLWWLFTLPRGSRTIFSGMISNMSVVYNNVFVYVCVQIYQTYLTESLHKMKLNEIN